ncbi:cold-shock protein [Streptomyces syringium]
MATGTVKWFNSTKGYGFISPDSSQGSETDIFVHHSNIDMPGYRFLQERQRVQFEVVESERGVHAEQVRTLPPSADTSTADML